MSELSPSRYKRLGHPFIYGQSDGVYYDTEEDRLVLVKDGVVYAISPYGTSSLAGTAAGTTFAADVATYGLATGAAVAVEGDAENGIGVYGYASGTGYGGWFEQAGTGSPLRIVPKAAAPSAAALLGDHYVNVAGELRRCITAGTPGKFRGISPAAKEMSDDFNALATTGQVPITRFDGVAFSGATGILHHLVAPSGNIYGVIPKGAGQTLPPVIVAAGLDIGGDQTTTEGYEVFSHFLGATGRPFIVGTDPAFYFKCKFQINDADGLDTLIVGFRRAEAQQAAYASYADYAGLGLNTAADPMAVKTITELNGGGTTVTDTTQTLAQATAVQFKVLVSAAGVVTFQHDIVTPGTLAAPTAVGTMTFDADDPVIPFFNFLNSANLADAVIIHSWEAGYQ